MHEAISFTPQVAASPIAEILWLIPALPIVASGVIALFKQPRRKAAAALSIGSLGFSLIGVPCAKRNSHSDGPAIPCT